MCQHWAPGHLKAMECKGFQECHPGRNLLNKDLPPEERGSAWPLCLGRSLNDQHHQLHFHLKFYYINKKKTKNPHKTKF